MSEKKELNAKNLGDASGGWFLTEEDVMRKLEENGGTLTENDIFEIAKGLVTYRCSKCGTKVQKLAYTESLTRTVRPPACPKCCTWSDMEKIK